MKHPLPNHVKEAILTESAERRVARAQHEKWRKQNFVWELTKIVSIYAFVFVLGLALAALRLTGSVQAAVGILFEILLSLFLSGIVVSTWLVRSAKNDPTRMIEYARIGASSGQAADDEKGFAPVCAMCERIIGMPDAVHGECPMCLADVPPEHPLWSELEHFEKLVQEKASHEAEVKAPPHV